MDKCEKVFVVPGNPIALARGRITNGRVYDAQKQVKINWGILIDYQNKENFKYNGPLHIYATFFFPMPQSKKKLWERLQNSPMFYRPDLDNILKFLLDVIQKILFDNDAQIASITAHKKYGYEPRTEFRIQELERSI